MLFFTVLIGNYFINFIVQLLFENKMKSKSRKFSILFNKQRFAHIYAYKFNYFDQILDFSLEIYLLNI